MTKNPTPSKPAPAPITVIDRATGLDFTENVMGEKYIRWAYQDARASFVHKLLFRSALISKAMGLWYDSALSKSKIAPAIQELGIDTQEFRDPIESFASFNAFFARHLKPSARPYSDRACDIVSPADGRVLVFPKLDSDTYAPIKGYPFSITRLLPDDWQQFENGALAIIRLCPADYHRYHFPCNGQIINSRAHAGWLHSVNPVALSQGVDVFGINKRHSTLIDTAEAGVMCFAEVGAFGVGSIVNTRTTGAVQKMDEKGFFKFGGSTVVLLFEPGKIQFSADLVANSAHGKETLVKLGQPLATASAAQ